MNIKRTLFWLSFIIVLVLIIWGLIVAMKKPINSGKVGTPAPISATDHTRGPANAPVTLIEYGDFQCPACGNYYPYVERLFDESSSTLRMVFRHFPLTLPHPHAQFASQAAEAAGKQGKFWEMYKKLYENQKAWSTLSDVHATFESYATAIGLDLATYKTDVDSEAVKKVVTDSMAEGDKIGVASTPTFFINGAVIESPQNYDDFKNTIDAAAAAAK